MSDSEKREYQVKLGQEFGAVFYGVRNDWLDGLVRLKEYRVLFADPDAVKLLNALGGSFMWDVQQILWRDLLLHITRVTDRDRIGERENLTVQQLPAFCESPEHRAQLQAVVDSAVQAANFARDWRNRRIGHSDLRLAMDPDAESLAPASLRQVQSALDAVHAVVATVGTLFLEAHIANDVTVPPRAQSFLAHARQLVTAVQYIDSIVDSTGSTPVLDRGVTQAFLEKVDRRPNKKEILQVIYLRDAARRFR